MPFDEHSETAKWIIDLFELFVTCVCIRPGLSFKDPPHDMARRFLNEIIEFEPVDKDGG